MAEDLNLKPDQAKALQSAMQVIEKLLGKSAGHSERLFGNVDKTAGKHQAYLNQKQKLLSFTKDLAKENKTIETSMKIKKLLIGSTLTIEQAELAVAKEKAIQEARSAGIAESRIVALSKQYDQAMKIADENARLNNLQEEQQKLSQKILQYDEDRKAVLGGINSTAGVFKDIMTDGRLAAGIFTNQLIKGLKTTTALFDHVRDEGHTVTQAFHETGLAIADSFSLTGVSAQDSMEVMSGMRAELGSIHKVTREARLEAASLAKTYGIGKAEAGQLTAQFSKLPGQTLESANNTLKFAGSLATAAHVAPGEVMKDIANNAEATAAFSKDGGKNIAIAAVAARKLGVEFGTIVGAAESLLDFESSIEKQMEASVLLGREINLDKARQLALDGDIVGATEEMLKNLGSEADFNKLNYKQRQIMAETMGVSVSQLGSMVKNQGELANLSEEQRQAISDGSVSMDEMLANAGGVASKLKEAAITGFSLVKGFGTLAGTFNNVSKMSKDLGIQNLKDLKTAIHYGVLKAKDYAMAVGHWVKQKVQWVAQRAHMLFVGGTGMGMKIKSYAIDTAHWIKQKAQWVAEKAHMIWKKAQAMVSGGGAAAKGAASAAGAAGKMGAAKSAASKIPKGAGNSTGGLTKSIEKIKPSKLLAGAAALVLVAAAVFVFAKAAQEFGSVSWESVGKAIVGMLALVGALALVGMIMTTPQGAIAILLGAAAMLIMAAALFVLGKAIQEIAKGFAIFTPALIELAPMAGQLILVGVSLAAVGAGLMILGASAWFAFGGLMLAAIGLHAMVPGLYMINEIAQNNVIGDLSTNLMSLSASASGLGAVGASLFGVAGGLGAMALAGFAALPVIGSLIALAAVAPALGKLADVFGGGGSGEDDKLGKIANKLDQLISVASQGGVINMDGKKVGDVLRLSVTSSGVK
tara:strand:+ start:694 stop:3465 length:2772 start_codon:yes stop_codon:yes gene_type:complete